MARSPYVRPRNRVQLDLDPYTLDRLEAAAAVRKVDKDRTAYELLQRALGIEPPPSITDEDPADPGRKIDLADFQAFKPPNNRN